MATKRKLADVSPEDEDVIDPSDELMFLCLGGGNEVGRSCHIIQYKGKTIMLDAGMHPAYEGLAALPFFDEFDLSTVDILLISHFHIDHAAGLPYVLSKTNFRGRIFMTHATKAIYKWLIQDSVRVGNTANSSEQKTQLYTEADHLNTFPQIEAIDYHTTRTINSVRITPYPAGHVLGAAMFLLEIAGLRILFTGDYSRENDRHLIPAAVPKDVKVDVLITESTFGVSSHVPRLEREAALMKSITGILNRGGRALLPVFALGRAQELLLILDEYWGKHPEYQKIPIYYASNLARKCMVVYQTYISAMNDNIKRLFRERMEEAGSSGTSGDINRGGPWDFKYIRSLKNLDRFDDVGGCVMLASPGMMQNGVSRELLERWAPDQKNGVIITGYSVEGTMARQIMLEPEQIHAISRSAGATSRIKAPGREGEAVMIPRRCSVQEFSFAAHVDGQENREFIEDIDAPVVILVHGEKHNMLRLKSKLLSLNASKPTHLKTKVFSPANCEELRIPIRMDKTAKVVGKLADRIRISRQSQNNGNSKLENGDDNGQDEKGRILPNQVISGVLVQNDLQLSLMDAEDLREYAGLTTTVITCRQKITLAAAGIELIRWALDGTFGGIVDLSSNHKSEETNGDASVVKTIKKEEEHDDDADEEVDRSTHRFLIMDTVTLTYRNQGEIEIEWEGNMINDGLADAVMSVLLTVESSPAAVKQSSKLHSHTHAHHSNGTSNDKNDTSPQAAAGQHQHNPHANSSITPEEKLSRLFMFLEAQFGADNVSPIAKPQPQLTSATTPTTTDTTPTCTETAITDDNEKLIKYTPTESAELARLHALGIPVPGIEIRVDKVAAKVWLEDLKVECASAVLRDRVGRVVQRAVECLSGLV